jgi:hypothetical protein
VETLGKQFDDAVRRVTISGEKEKRAIAAHKEVRGLLEADAQLCEWGIDSILIGSYARDTARYPGKDVDVFLRFSSLSVRHSPEKIYNAVARVLVDAYGLKGRDPDGRVTLQARSVKVDFPEDDDGVWDEAFSIDAVPAVPWGDHWGIPNRDRDAWDREEGRWILTDPLEFAARTLSLATADWSPTVSGRNAYRPVVRLLRQVRHVHLGGARPGGLFTEVAAYYTWLDRNATGDSWAELLTSTMDGVAARFREAADEGLPDPVLNKPMKPNLGTDTWRSAAIQFEQLANSAREAMRSERCWSARLWREILGDNERGPVLPLPDGCDANGFPISSIAAVEAVGSNEPRGFA